MQISYNPPHDKGVTSLMYVGDDDAVEKAARDSRILFGCIAAIVAIYVGYGAYKARK